MKLSVHQICGTLFAALMLTSLSGVAQVNRSIDGSGNNLANPTWGAANTQNTRWSSACYGDSISSPGGADRISPRAISNIVFDQPLPLVDVMGLSDFCWVYGQFLDHDVTLAPDGPEASFIAVPKGDVMFDPSHSGTAIIPMHRSLPAPGTGTSIANPREHVNAITAFIDGSNVYGSDINRANWLRSFSEGKLKTSPGNMLPYNTIDGTSATDVDVNAPHMDNPLPFYDKIYVAGDARANENPLLSAMHTIFMREHNRLCDVLLARNPGMSDEQVYQRARKLNGAIMQTIVFNEWLPTMGIQLPTYTGYKTSVDPTIANEFGAAAFRMGHTLLNSNLRRLTADGSPHPLGNLVLRDAYFNPTAIEATGSIDPFIKGMAEQTQQSFDAHVIHDVRNFLFGRPGSGGLDLAAININRGRERGLADYNMFRESLGLTRVSTLAEISSSADVQAALSSAFTSVDSIDLWVGMLAEEAMPNNLFGPTVNAAMSRQFTALRDGDRYFYMTDAELSADDRAVITSTRLSDVIRRNTDVEIMQGNVFTSMLHDSIPVCTATTAEADMNVKIELANGVVLPGALVRVYGMDDVMPQTVTSSSGIAAFTDLPTCDDYAAEAVVTTHPSEGVTGFDLYLIGQHILRNQVITDPFKLVAADVNRSGTITAFDLSNAQRVILGLETTYLGQDPWRIINPNYLPAPGDNVVSFDYLEKAHFNRFDGTVSATLIAIKAGDVDFSYSPLAPPLAPRSKKSLIVSIDEQDARQVRLLAAPGDAVAQQYELSVSGNNSITTVNGLSESSYVLSEDRKSLRVVNVDLGTGVNEVSLAFAKPVSSKPVVLNVMAENIAYTEAGTPFALDLAYTVAASIENREIPTFNPNPMTTTAQVNFPADLVDAGNDYVVLDGLGRELYRQTITTQQFELQRNDLNAPASGTITWYVESKGQRLFSGIVSLQ